MLKEELFKDFMGNYISCQEIENKIEDITYNTHLYKNIKFKKIKPLKNYQVKKEIKKLRQEKLQKHNSLIANVDQIVDLYDTLNLDIPNVSYFNSDRTCFDFLKNYLEDNSELLADIKELNDRTIPINWETVANYNNVTKFNFNILEEKLNYYISKIKETSDFQYKIIYVTLIENLYEFSWKLLNKFNPLNREEPYFSLSPVLKFKQIHDKDLSSVFEKIKLDFKLTTKNGNLFHFISDVESFFKISYRTYLFTAYSCLYSKFTKIHVLQEIFKEVIHLEELNVNTDTLFVPEVVDSSQSLADFLIEFIVNMLDYKEQELLSIKLNKEIQEKKEKSRKEQESIEKLNSARQKVNILKDLLD